MGRRIVYNGAWSRTVTGALALVMMAAVPAAAQMTFTVAQRGPSPAGSAATPVSAQADDVARTTLAQRPVVTLAVKDSSIAYVVHELTRQAHLQLSYRDDNPEFAKRVTVTVKKMAVMDALGVALKNTGLVAELSPDGQMVVIRARAGAPATPQADAGIIQGQVVDSARGRGIGNATVRVRGLKLSVVTNDSGRFVLPGVPAGPCTIAVTALGYRPVTQAVDVLDGARTTVTVTLGATATVLSGVVTTATGVQRRLDVGSDVTTINVDSVMRVAPVKSLTDLLDTRIPGATVMRSSGVPGDPARIRLRRASSIQENNNPIVIVDGVRITYDQKDDAQLPFINGTGNQYPAPSALDQIDPNSIEKIDVFKGPSASAMYGSDAANGVIVITTKRGRPGPTHWSLNTDFGFNEIPGSYPTLTYSFGHLIGGGNSPGMLCPRTGAFACVADSSVTFQALNDPRYTPFTRGGSQSATATVSGGVESLLYSFTGSGLKDRGTVRLPDAAADQYVRFAGVAPPSWMSHPDQYQTWSGSSRLTAKLSPTATASLSNDIASSHQARSSMDAGSVGRLIGVFVDTTRLGFSPLLSGFLERALTDEFTSRTSGTGDWEPRSWLHLQVTGGLDNRHRQSKSYMPSGLPDELLQSPSDSTGHYALAKEDALTKTMNSNGTVSIPLPRSASIAISTGFGVTQSSFSTSTVRTDALPTGVTDPTNFPVGSGTFVYQSIVSQTTYGWYVEPQLHLSSRFTISPGIRLDGGSASGSNAGLTLFPKTSVSWLVIDQSASAGSNGLWRDVLSSLRLRGAYGLAGVQPDPTARLRLYTIGTSVLNGSTSLTSVTPSSVGNTHIRPERSSELEGGFDTDLFDYRGSFGFTMYHKKRLDAILPILLAPSAGGGSQQVNIGTVTVTGLELTASARVIDRPGLQWTVNMSASNSHSQLVSLGAGIPFASPGGLDGRLVPGYPIDGIWVRPLVGFTDANGDGIIERNELVFSDSAKYLGSQDPHYTSAFGSTVALLNGRLSANVNFAYTNGLTQYNALGLAELASAASGDDVTLAQQAVYLATLSPPANSTGYALYQTVNTLRLQSASLNLTLPVAVARLFHAGSASVALQGSNLWLHTNYRGKDPDVNGYTQGEGVADFGQIPEPRLWTLSLRLN